MKTNGVNNWLIKLLIGWVVFSVIFAIGGAIYLYHEQQVKKAHELACQAQVAANDLKLESFYPKIGSYSQVMSLSLSSEAREKLVSEWKTATDQVVQSAVGCPNQASILDWQAGEMYRLGYNLDYPGSWEKAESLLLKSSQEDPAYIKPLLSLAFLYVNSDMSQAKKAEEVLLKAEKLATTTEDKLTIYNGLFFAYYYQGDRVNAEAAIDKALGLAPTDDSFLSLKKMLQVLKKQK